MSTNRELPSNSAAEPRSDVHIAGWQLGVVARVSSRERGFLFLRDEQGQEYFAHRSGWLAPELFDVIAQGTAVRFRAVRKPKGLQAHTVGEASAEDAERVRTWADDVGNR